MINQAKALLEQGKIDIFLGYKKIDNHDIPHAFTRENLAELSELTVSDNRYPLEKTALNLSKANPAIKIGMIARDCNQRALNVLYINNQLKQENIETVTINCCPSKQKDVADCSYLKPLQAGLSKTKYGIDSNMKPDSMIDTYDNEER